MKQIIGQQGEVRIIKIDAMPDVETAAVAPKAKGFVISHSESGNDHVLTGGDVMERTEVPEGMQIFYAILDDPQSLIQDAGGNSHGQFDLDPGIYEFRISREHDPFSEQVRRVMD